MKPKKRLAVWVTMRTGLWCEKLPYIVSIVPCEEEHEELEARIQVRRK